MEKPIVAAAADDERETGAGNNMAETILSPPHLEGRIQSQCFLGGPRDINESGNCPIRFLSATGEEKPSTNKREILFCADRGDGFDLYKCHQQRPAQYYSEW